MGTTLARTGPEGHRLAFPLAVALVCLVAHVPFLAPTLEDVDSINFALGVRDFDPARHQPHPPGTPVFVALAKLSTAAFDLVSPAGAAGAAKEAVAAAETDGGPVRAENAARGLALWSAVFGALAVFPLLRLYERLDGAGPRHARAALLLAMACPLMWFTAVRPLSDVTGLAAAIAGQALLASAWLRQRTAGGRAATGAATQPSDTARDSAAADRLLVLGTFVSAFSVGVRSQVLWLTLPLLLVVLVARARRGAGGLVVRAGVAAAIGVALWAVPLVVASGGIERYLGALAIQGGEDFAFVDMLWRNPTPRRLAFGVIQTFVFPWASVPVAVVVLALALVGAVIMVRRNVAGAGLLLAAYGPYAVFHLLFHETVTTRYALPLVPAVAYLAASGARIVAGRFRALVVAGLVVASLAFVLPPVVRYGREGSPVMRLMGDLRRTERAADRAAVLAVTVEARRAAEWGLAGTALWARALPTPAKRDWFEVVRYWRSGGSAPIWFLVEPWRTDLALVDPQAARLRAAYRWPFSKAYLIGGVRPGDIDWYEIGPPGWFVDEGWGLTPAAAGMAHADGKGPARAPVEAWIRRRAGAAMMMIGGRNLGGSADPLVRFTVALDGRVIDTVDVQGPPGFFLRFLPLSAGSLEGAGPYARVTVSASPLTESPRPVAAAVEQFDLQDAGGVVYGFDAGWHELEYNPATGRLWRWSSEAATVRVQSGGEDVVLQFSGESPLQDFDRAPTVTVRAGSSVLGSYRPSSAFTYDLRVSAPVLERAGGVVTLETDRTFVPDERTHNGDRRRLGLRVYGLTVRPARGLSGR